MTPRRAALPLLLAAVAVTVAACGSKGAAGGPSHDRFYRYRGPTPLAAVAPGTPLAERAVTLRTGHVRDPGRAEQILYRTTTATGQPAVSVTTVALPASGTAHPRVLAYMSAYDALTNRCDPSWTLSGGDPGAANERSAELDAGVVARLRAAGYIVTVPDFEDETLDFLTGPEAGRSALDAVRATIAALHLGGTVPVALMGYSGGSVATDWASELAPRYAPGVHLVGVAEGGVPVDPAHNLAYINGSAAWSDLIPAALIGISRGFHLDLDRYLSAYGRRIVATDSGECLGQFLGAHPHLRISQLIAPGRAGAATAALRGPQDDLIMGTAPGHPAEPLLLVAGNSDGTGDGIMVEKDEAALAHEYCSQGVAVDFEELVGRNHQEAGQAFVAGAAAYLAGRFSGAPAPRDCARIPPGNPLSPAGPLTPAG